VDAPASVPVGASMHVVVRATSLVRGQPAPVSAVNLFLEITVRGGAGVRWKAAKTNRLGLADVDLLALAVPTEYTLSAYADKGRRYAVAPPRSRSAADEAGRLGPSAMTRARPGRQLRLVVVVLVALLVPLACTARPPPIGAPVPGPAAGPAGSDPVIGAAGDIACAPAGEVTPAGCHQQVTSDLLIDMVPTAVLALGDLQYETGRRSGFEEVYARTWGRLKRITRPVPGNHEYKTAGAKGYFDYFGAAAGDPAKGWYSYDLGAWHLIALNSECDHVGGCGPGSPQERWLRGDLAAHRNACTLAYWHRARFSSGTHGNYEAYDAFWRALYEAGADLVLNAHDHNYERFAPQDPDGRPDPARGIREFVVGTGGKNHYAIKVVKANSEVIGQPFGVLKLTLRPSGYEWRFLSEAGGGFADAGSGRCH
jgi:hypothetical protein